METQPLHWPVDWNKLSFNERMFMWNPLFGKSIRIHANLCEQIKSRDNNDLCLWKPCSDEIREQANKVSEILIAHLGWPKNSVFIPNDPAEIILWDQTGDLDSVEAVISIENVIGVTMPDEFGKMFQAYPSSGC